MFQFEIRPALLDIQQDEVGHMVKQLVVYLDNCVFSRLLEPINVRLREMFLNFPHRLAFSHVHLTEMQGNVNASAALLTELNAVFIRNPGADHDQYHPIASIDVGNPLERFADYQEVAAAYSALEAMLAPFQHFSDGRRELSQADIVVSTETRVKSALDDMFSFASEPEIATLLAAFTPNLMKHLLILWQSTLRMAGQKLTHSSRPRDTATRCGG